MFEVSNPLRFYTRQPGRDGSVPPLAKPQAKLRDNGRFTNWILNFCIFLLVIVILITIGLVINRALEGHQPTEDSQECVACISFEELKRKAEVNIKDAQEYIKEKVNLALSIKFPKGSQSLNISIKDLNNKLTRFPELRERVNQLIAAKSTSLSIFDEAFCIIF